jgi:hypothetical protein
VTRAAAVVAAVAIAGALVRWWLVERDRKLAVAAEEREKQRQAQELDRLKEQAVSDERKREADMRRWAGPVRPPLLPSWGDRAYACRSDDDCRLTRVSDGGRCCRGCGVEAYAKPFATALEQQETRACEKSPCQLNHMCAPHGKTARCIDGRCSTGRSKSARPPPTKCNCPPGDPLCACE